MSDTLDSADPSDPFEVAVGKWVNRAKGLATRALQATALDALARVKELTPVDTGTLRANWTLILPGEPMPVVNQIPDPSEVVARLRMGDSIVLANPVVYARRIEYGFVGEDKSGRNYDQAGVGMMTQTIHELPEIARLATARVIAGGS